MIFPLTIISRKNNKVNCVKLNFLQLIHYDYHNIIRKCCDNMTARNAVRQRILDLCNSRNITVNKLCTISGVTQSTLNNIINVGSNNPTISTIAKICDGLEITLRYFFNDDVFEDIEQEIK